MQEKFSDCLAPSLRADGFQLHRKNQEEHNHVNYKHNSQEMIFMQFLQACLNNRPYFFWGNFAVYVRIIYWAENHTPVKQGGRIIRLKWNASNSGISSITCKQPISSHLDIWPKFQNCCYPGVLPVLDRLYLYPFHKKIVSRCSDDNGLGASLHAA